MADHYTFLSWIRDGAAAEIGLEERRDTDGRLDTGGPVRAPLRVRLDVETRPDAESGPAGRVDPVQVRLAVHGPGDVASLDPEEILCVEPPPNTSGFEPNALPFVEFRRADLPWLFSPRAGTATERHKLRPWLTLIVVPEDAASFLPGDPGALPRLRCALRELPEPDDSWAWAHAQVRELEADEPIHDVVANSDGRALSRLLGSRRLEPGRRYVAALVPTFLVGVEAALGQGVRTATLEPAWPSLGDAAAKDDGDVDGGTEIVLPLYHHWRFATGEAGDFESLVRRLKPHAAPGGDAVRRLDVGDPGAGVIVREPGDAPETLPFAGALAPGGHVAARWTTPAGARFAAELRARFDAAADARTTVVGPPLYGARHAGLARLPAEGEGPHWLRELNTDPRLRAYAGLGAETVARRQEALMASAWDQLDDVESVNAARNRAALAETVGRSTLRRRVNRLRRATLLQTTRGAHAVAALGGESVRGALAASDAPSGLVDPALRRILGPRGPLVRRSANPVGALDAHAVVERAVTGAIVIDTSPTSGSSLSIRLILEDAVKAASKANDHETRIQLTRFQDAFRKSDHWDQILVKQRQTFRFGGYEEWTKDAPRATPGSGRAFNILLDTMPRIEEGFDLAIDLLARQRQRLDDPPVTRERQNPDTDALASALKATLDPALTVGTQLARRIDTDLAPAGDGPAAFALAAGAPLRAAPVFPQPMVDTLREEMPGFVLDGIERVPPDSITLLQTNPAFVLAYLIGLNHAMAGELLWRGFPTDRRGTHFRRFWNRAGLTAASGGRDGEAEAPFDIPPLDELPPALRLLGDGDGAAPEMLVLTVRGELLRRHPHASIRLCPAARDGMARVPVPARTRAPLFSVRLGDDVVLLAFDLPLAEARGDGGGEGWFVVFREPPSGIRFGLDVTAANADGVPSSLDDLAWPHVLDAAGGARHLSVRHGLLAEGKTFDERVTLDDARRGDDPRGDEAAVTWGANGAHMARALMQWPVSIAYHADALLPADGTRTDTNRGAIR